MANPDHVATVLLIAGPMGSGKSTLARRFASGWRRRWLAVFDTVGQWSRFEGMAPVLSWHQAGLQLAAGRLIYNPKPMFAGERERAFDGFCALVWGCFTKVNQPKLVVVEDIDRVCGCGATKLPRGLADIVVAGREEEIDFMAITHSPSQVHASIRREVTHTAVFHFDDPAQLDWLARLDLDPDAIKALPRFAYLWKERGQPARVIQS